MNTKVCMCGRILAQHGDTCVKDDTIRRGKPACTKERATEACACGDKVTCKKGLFCHGLDNPNWKQFKREQEGATTKAPVSNRIYFQTCCNRFKNILVTENFSLFFVFKNVFWYPDSASFTIYISWNFLNLRRPTVKVHQNC